MSPSSHGSARRSSRRQITRAVADRFSATTIDRTTAMRRPRPRVNSASAPFSATPPLLILAANRMGYGLNADMVIRFNALGSTDLERFENYIDQQLSPSTINDATFDPWYALAGFQTLQKPLTQLWNDHHEHNQGWSHRMQPATETEHVTFMRAVFSRKQLQEVLVEFWHDHFNVYGWDYWTGPIWSDYDRVIRLNTLGNFRVLLDSVTKHTCMLYFLDNYTSSVDGPNENFARELCELHTLGAENYLGVRPWQSVPTDANGNRVGYVDDDVYEATRAFTGWTVNNGSSGTAGDDGTFFYRAEDHDRFQKIFLGQFLNADQAPMKDGHDCLDLLAYHPGTARHIARKLCRRLISDDPPQSIVDAAAQVFAANQTATDQIALTVRTILRSDEFKQTWGEKTKRPFEVVVSALRSTQANLLFALDADDVDSFLWRYEQTGQPLFSWRAPDGYPDTAEKWQSVSPRVMTWRLCQWLVRITTPAGAHRLNVVEQTPANLRSSEEIASYWIGRVLGRSMSAADHQEFVDFMAQGFNPNQDLNLGDEDTADRLRSMVALLFNSPYFLER